MSISRRRFLGTGSLVALTAGFPLKALAEEAGAIERRGSKSKSFPASGVSLEAVGLNSEAFSRCLNTKFRVHKRNADAAILKLVEVKHWQSGSSRSRNATTGRECFSVMLLGSRNTQLRQDTYAVEHESLGKFQLFIVPMNESKQGLHYEAVFNRLH
jgi:hypothetical protein